METEKIHGNVDENIFDVYWSVHCCDELKNQPDAT
jgi:hypothetical protein